MAASSSAWRIVAPRSGDESSGEGIARAYRVGHRYGEGRLLPDLFAVAGPCAVLVAFEDREPGALAEEPVAEARRVGKTADGHCLLLACQHDVGGPAELPHAVELDVERAELVPDVRVEEHGHAGLPGGPDGAERGRERGRRDGTGHPGHAEHPALAEVADVQVVGPEAAAG
jgi:hypothetical protein